MLNKLVFLLVFLVSAQAFSDDSFESLLTADYKDAQFSSSDESDENLIEPYWHNPPVWPKEECRRNPDPSLSSARRGGLISYTNLLSQRTIFFIMPAVSAEHLRPGELKLRMLTNLASVHQFHTENGFDIKSDYQISEVTLEAAQQVTERIQLSAYARGYYHSAGRLDDELNDFHDFFGFPKGERGDAPSDQYINTFSKDGKAIHTVRNNRFGLGDSLLIVKYKALDQTKNLPTISIIVGVKAPTGDHSLGYTSDGWDTGLGLALSKQLTPSWKMHWNIAATEPGHSSIFNNLTTIFSTMMAFEYYVNKWLSLVIQTNYNTSPFANYPFQGMNADSWTAGIGFHVTLPFGVQFQAHFTDEFYNHGDTDYVFGLAIDIWDYIFGR